MSPEVTSRHHRIVHACRSAARREGDTALLDGWHLLHEAADARIAIATVAISQAPPTSRDAALIDRLSRHAEVLTVSESVMNALSPVRTPAGVVAIVRPRDAKFDAVLTPTPALVVVTVDLQDPGNAGAVVRSAEAGGATGVVLAGASADPWGWKALRAAMGSTFRVAVVREPDIASALRRLREAQLSLVATLPRTRLSMYDVDFRRNVALILGGEGAGLSESVADACDQRASIPMSGSVESLNVAVAAALLVYEARRQRQAMK